MNHKVERERETVGGGGGDGGGAGGGEISSDFAVSSLFFDI